MLSLNWPQAPPETEDEPIVRPSRRGGRRPRPAGTPLRPVNWRRATKQERGAAIASIRSQLEAFRSDNYEKAIALQSDSLKQNFTPESFREMIRGSYPQFANFRKVEFGQGRTEPTSRTVSIPIEIIGRDGNITQATYMMSWENKSYRVAGVMSGGFRNRAVPDEPDLVLSPNLRRR